jgi:hypothetical protein
MAQSLDHRHHGTLVGKECWIVESCGPVERAGVRKLA